MIRAMGLVFPAQVSGNQLVALYARYEEMQSTEAWKDFVARMVAKRQRLVNDLLKPRPKRSDTDSTDEFMRAALYAMDCLLDIPLQIRNTYNDMRAQEETKARIQARYIGDGPSEDSPVSFF